MLHPVYVSRPLRPILLISRRCALRRSRQRHREEERDTADVGRWRRNDTARPSARESISRWYYVLQTKDQIKTYTIVGSISVFVRRASSRIEGELRRGAYPDTASEHANERRRADVDIACRAGRSSRIFLSFHTDLYHRPDTSRPMLGQRQLTSRSPHRPKTTAPKPFNRICDEQLASEAEHGRESTFYLRHVILIAQVILISSSSTSVAESRCMR